jgi:N-acetylmuramoyl-L-alanine amidase
VSARRGGALLVLVAVAAVVVVARGHVAGQSASPPSGGVDAIAIAIATPTPTPTASASTSTSPPSHPPTPVAATPAHHHRTHPTAPPTVSGDLFAGVTVGIDPGHDGGNYTDPSYLNRQIWNGREHEDCDTTGTQTDAGYTEARFTFAVAAYLAADLRQAGATVVLTRRTNTGVGPCVDRRAYIIDAARAAVAIDIHADGGPASGRGFAVLEPVPDGPNDSVVATSRTYGTYLRDAFEQTGMPTSTYDGTDGITLRDDLAGLNLTTVPKVLIECGNMRNPTDAALLISPSFQRRAAAAIMSGMATFLAKRQQ